MKKEINNTSLGGRAYSLDALRGYAIITMVLSGQIISWILPSWMSHAQVPPPAGIFNPDIYGITWVDLVFPFFLFAMGAAFPFSIGKKIAKGEKKIKIALESIFRGLKLTFFAIFIQHLYPWSISTDPDYVTYLLSLLGFLLLFPMFMRMPWKMSRWMRYAIELAAYVAATVLMLSIKYPDGKEFSLYYSNIIILVLANMAIFGSIIYIATINNKWARLGVLPFVMALLLIGGNQDGWQSAFYNFSPFKWMYNFMFLKYLFIVIPGSIAGEYLLKWSNNKGAQKSKNTTERRNTWLLLLLCIAIIIFNLWGLFTRNLVINLFGTIAMLVFMYMVIKGESVNMKFWKNLFVAGAYLLMLGLFFEAFEGGIRKDDSTFSYYFVTSGLACFALIAFSIMSDVYRWTYIVKPLEMAGQNPMIAYVATALFITPVLNLTRLSTFLPLFETDPWLGFLRGVILTALAAMTAMFFTRIKWFWRT